MAELLKGIQLTEDEADAILHCLKVYEDWDTTGHYDSQIHALIGRLEYLYPELKEDNTKQGEK